MLEWMSRKNFIIFNKDLPLICQGHIAAAWLLAGLHDRYEFHEQNGELIEKDGLIWFYLTVDKASEMFTISKTQQLSAIKKLSQLGFITVKRFGSDGKRHFTLHEDAINNAKNLAHPEQPDVTKRDNRMSQNATSQSNSYNVLSNPIDHTLVNNIADAMSPSNDENHRTNAVHNSHHKKLPPQALQLSALLLGLIQVRAPKTKANINNWAKELDLMNRVDGLSWGEIERLIRFVHQEDDFWFEQILSTKKLRKHATALTVKMNKNRSLTSAQPKKQDSLLPYDNDPELRAEERKLWLQEQQSMQQQHREKQDANRT